MRAVRIGAAVAAALYLVVVAALFLGQRRLLYQPFGSFGAPADSGLPEMTAVRVRTADGLDNLAWFAPPRVAGAPTVVFFHGNACNLSCWSYKARAFVDAGLGMMMTGYRGYEGNGGDPDEAGLFADARAALDWLAGRGIAGRDVVLYGESLGSGVAVRMASERPVAAVVLEAPYTTIADVARHHLPFVPVGWLLRDRFDSLARIQDVQAPLLIVHGDRDTLIPSMLGRALYAAAREPKRALWIADGGHSDLWGSIRDTVMRFVAQRGR
jgi:fermentation-respiration switch protein FrsA (DUF1100 family)